MASKTYYVGFNGLISRLDNLNFDPNGNTYTNWVNLRTYFDQSFNVSPQGNGESLWDVMTIPGNKDKVFVVGTVRGINLPWKGIAYSTTAGQNTTTPAASFITPGFPGGAVTTHIGNYITATEVPYNFYEVWCVDSNTIYACGDSGTVIRSVDGGTNFTLHTVPNALFNIPVSQIAPGVVSIHFDTPDNGVIGSVDHVFTTTTGSGACTWLPTAPVPLNTSVIKGIYKKGNLIVGVSSSQIICSTNGGSSWTTQYTWSELGLTPFLKNGEHLTWYYDKCNNIVYFRATGRRNEIVQAAYKFGTVNSFINPVTGALLTVGTAWTTFNGHIYDPTVATNTVPAKNYYAAHFYKPFEGFLGRTDAPNNGSYTPGERKVDYFVSNSEIPNVDQTPTTKNKILMAIWTEIDAIPYYSLQKCGSQDYLYVQPGTTTSNIASLAGETVIDVIVDGLVDPNCWTVTGPLTCVTLSTSTVDTLSVTVTTGCQSATCTECYKLIACEPATDDKGQVYFPSISVYSDDITFDLDDYLYQVFQFNDESLQGFCPGKCFYLTKSTVCQTPIAFPVNASYSIFDNCEECLPKCPVELNTRSVKPGFYTPGCPPDYTVKTNCMYAEQVYDEMVAVRYGITICCDHDVDKWDIKKQLLDLRALFDECLCVSAVCPTCVAPCNVEASVLIYIEDPIPPPPAPPCYPPSNPIQIQLT